MSDTTDSAFGRIVFSTKGALFLLFLIRWRLSVRSVINSYEKGMRTKLSHVSYNHCLDMTLLIIVFQAVARLLKLPLIYLARGVSSRHSKSNFRVMLVNCLQMDLLRSVKMGVDSIFAKMLPPKSLIMGKI